MYVYKRIDKYDFEEWEKKIYCRDLDNFISKNITTNNYMKLLEVEKAIKTLLTVCGKKEKAKRYAEKLAEIVGVKVEDPLLELQKIHDELIKKVAFDRIINVNDNLDEYTVDFETDDKNMLLLSLGIDYLKKAKKLQEKYSGSDRGKQYILLTDSELLLKLGVHKARVFFEDERLVLEYRDHSTTRAKALARAIEDNGVGKVVDRNGGKVIAEINVSPEKLQCLATILANTTSLDLQGKIEKLVEWGCRLRE